MKLLLTVHRGDPHPADVVVTTDIAATVGDVAQALRTRPTGARDDSSPTLLLVGTGSGQTLDPRLPISEAPVGSGDHVAVGEARTPSGGSGLELRVLSGPDAGKRVPLRVGLSIVGRDPRCNVVLNDPMVSKRHAKIIVGETVEVIDDNSANGVLSSGEIVQRLVLTAGDRFTLGDSVIMIEGIAAKRASRDGTAGAIAFNRSPRLDPRYAGQELVAPEPPEPQRAQRIPLITALVPLVMGGFLFAITKSVFSIAFVAMSPLMLVGSFLENRRVTKRTFKEDVETFEQNLAELVVQLRAAHDEERAGRQHEHPSTAEVVEAVRDLSPLTWTRRPEHDSFLGLRLGLGKQPSRTTVELPKSRKAPVDLQRQLQESITPFASIDNVPVVCQLQTGGCLGVSGPIEVRDGVAAGLVAQLVGLHSPADVTVMAIASVTSSARWDWLKWLPHVESEHTPLSAPALVSSAGAVAALIADLNGLIGDRASSEGTGENADHPAVLVLVEDDAPFVRSALVEVADRGRDVGVHVLWFADSTPQLPSVCRTFLELAPTSFGAATGKVIEGERVEPVIVEALDQEGANWFGRRLAPVLDASVGAGTESDVPATVSFVTESSAEITSEPSFVIERWIESSSVRAARGTPRRLKRDNTLRALVGRTATDALHLDLRAHGPHALVGGTTGAGKSEFLQTWILAMAATHSPERVTFLFVDYKGGAAFADCITLPHAVGLVTDLSPHLVQRALRSLNAELRYREHVLHRKRAKDLLELERRQDPDTPPSLVIVVDEFAALVQEVPEFVDGVVNVAQRGRSLGLHLILATQRPAGVIKGNLRANTNLRVALRMADSDDSTDVIGVPLAAEFDPAIPGRGIVKTGPGRLSTFQTCYVGGVTAPNDHLASIEVRDLTFGEGRVWEDEGLDETDLPLEDDTTAPDIGRIVSTICSAATELGLPTPRKPWLPELVSVYDLAALPTKRTDSELVFGVLDEPDEQAQEAVAFHPDTDGSMVVYGTSGSGKSTFLRSIAVAAGLTARGGPCHVYGLDFGSRGLTMLEALPHVGGVISGDDLERTVRLFRLLKETLDARASRYSKVNAGTIEEYRHLAGEPDEPRIFLLLDGYGTFRSTYEIGPYAWLNDALHALASDGRPLGIHVILSADRPGTVPSSLGGAVQKRLVLRLASEDDLLMSGAPKDGFGEHTPPGRGFLEADEAQVAILGGKADATSQARALEKLARSMARAGAAPAPAIASLPERVPLGELPPAADGLPVFGLADETLAPIGFDPSGVLLVAGPSGSGRSTAVATLVHALGRTRSDLAAAYLGQRRSPLASQSDWAHAAAGPQDCAALASELTELLTAQTDNPPLSTVVLDGLGDFVSSEADFPLQELLKACRTAGVLVIADGETSELGGSWPLLQAVRAPRHGLVLQPDQMDGDMLFKTPFPRVRRADFPLGRGFYVRQGRAQRVQVAVPS